MPNLISAASEAQAWGLQAGAGTACAGAGRREHLPPPQPRAWGGTHGTVRGCGYEPRPPCARKSWQDSEA